MKSFSNFLLEKKPLDITNDPKGGEKFLRNLRKKSVQNQTDVKTVDRPADVQGRMDATNPKQGGYSRVDDSLDSKPSGKRQLSNTTKGGEVRTIRPPDSPSGNENRKLGKLNKKTGKLNFSANKELQAKRKLRVDTTTGKATPKGVENYAQGRGGYGRTTGKPRNMGKPEWESRKAQAKQIASDPSSKAYKDIERKINTSDYAGKRAKGASPTELKGIRSDIANSKTVNAKGGKLNIPRRGNVVPLNTSTRKGKIVKPTTVVKQSEVSKKIAQSTKQYNINRTTGQTSLFPETQPKSGTKTQGFRPNNTPDPNIIKKPKNYNPNQGVLDLSKTKPSSTPPKPPTGVDVTDLTKKSKVTTGNKLPNQGFRDSGVPPQPPKPKASSKITGNKAWQHLAKQGKLDTYKKPATVMTKGMKTYKQFLTKTPKPLRSLVKGGGKVVGKALGPAFAAVDAVGNYQGYKKQGYGTTGSIVRSGAKTGAYWGGYAAGAAKGAALGSFAGPVGTVVGGIAGGIIGGGLAGKVADWGIGAYDKVFGGKKLKALKQSNIAKDLKANPWKAYGGKTPQISKKKTKFDQGSFRTVQLKKAKDGSYIMPKGWKKNTGEGSRLSKTTRLTA